MTDSQGSLVVVIMDVNMSPSLLAEHGRLLSRCLDAVLVFCNSHLMMSSRNKLAVIGCTLSHNRYLYPRPGVSDTASDRSQLFTEVDDCIKSELKAMMEETKMSDRLSLDSPIASAAARALCYIRRVQAELPTRMSMSCRVLLVSSRGEVTSQYMDLMNVFFTAQKNNVPIDACMLDKDSGILQQGCDITGGVYLRVPQIQGLLQYLLWVFLPEPSVRQKLVLPPPVKVDYRAACFCHRELIDIGYVCSVCLSIFCKFSPICTTCHSVFKNLGPPVPKAKKRKLKS